LIRLAWASVANVAIAPLQDILSLGTAARMNYPGRGEGNWRWRFHADQLTQRDQTRLRELTEVYGRAKR
jgi:4-alpha-glucanotransferase